MKLFVVNYSHHDISALGMENAEKIVNLTEGKVNIFHTDRLKAEMLAIMKQEGVTDKDFLVTSGTNILNVLAALAMKEITGVVNVMLFNFNDKKYYKRTNI